MIRRIGEAVKPGQRYGLRPGVYAVLLQGDRGIQTWVAGETAKQFRIELHLLGTVERLRGNAAAAKDALPAKEHALFRSIVKFYDSKQYKKGVKAADGLVVLRH